MVIPGRGPSINVDPNKVVQFGGAYKIEKLPEGLQITPHGNPGHYKIIPEYPMTKAEFQDKLNQIITSPLR